MSETIKWATRPGNVLDPPGMVSILNDWQIAGLCLGNKPMISPFDPKQLDPFGYNIRLDLRFLSLEGQANPMLNAAKLPPLDYRGEQIASAFDLAPHSLVIKESGEWFAVPKDVLGIFHMKTSYAWRGLLVNAAPLGPGWEGRLALVLANLSSSFVRLEVGQVIGQVVFFRRLPPKRVHR